MRPRLKNLNWAKMLGNSRITRGATAWTHPPRPISPSSGGSVSTGGVASCSAVMSAEFSLRWRWVRARSTFSACWSSGQGNSSRGPRSSAAVWPETVVEDSNLNVQIAALRRVLDEGRTERSCIQTIPGRGYRFTAPVTRVAAEARANTALPISGVPPLPDKPSLAVMPFQNMSGDPEQEYFADGMVEEIITALSRIRWLFVIARNSSFTYKGQAFDVKQVGRELGVRYVLEGAVTQSRRPRAHHRAADRRDDRRASLGRPVRRFIGRHLRASGQGGGQRCRRHRADLGSGRDPPLGRAADERPYRPRPLSARTPALGRIRKEPHPSGARPARASDRARPALRPGSRPGGPLPPRARGQRLGRRPRGDPARQYRSRAAGASKQSGRPQRSRTCRLSPRLLGPGHRRLTRIDRPLSHAQPEPCPWLALERLAQGLCRPARSRARAFSRTTCASARAIAWQLI